MPNLLAVLDVVPPNAAHDPDQQKSLVVSLMVFAALFLWFVSYSSRRGRRRQ